MRQVSLSSSIRARLRTRMKVEGNGLRVVPATKEARAAPPGASRPSALARAHCTAGDRSSSVPLVPV